MLSTIKKYEEEDEALEKIRREAIKQARFEILAENKKAIIHRKYVTSNIFNYILFTFS